MSTESGTPDAGITLSEMADDVIAGEDPTNSEATTQPPTPKDIRITQKNLSIREIYLQIEDGELDLAPDFQRSFVWKPAQQVRLIESILMGIPMPAFYFNQDKSGAQQVVDGVQRLTTIKRFMANEFALTKDDLASLSDEAGRTYETLEGATKRRFANTQIVAYIIEPQTPDALKYDIFNRVNTGGTPLSAQEIRHCMSKLRSRRFLCGLVELPEFDKVTERHFWSRGNRDDKRMVNREFALRFCAFYLNPIEGYSNAHSLDAYLLECSHQLDQPEVISDDKLAQLQAAFALAMENACVILGNLAFRRYQGENTRRGPLNRAVFESQALALAHYPTGVLLPHQAAIRAGLLGLFSEVEYDRAVGTSTGNYSKLKHRLERPRQVLQEILGC